MDIATPIVENLRVKQQAQNPVPNHIQDRRNAPRKGEPCPIWSRLSTPPERHVRLDNAERLFFDYLKELASRPDSRLIIRRGAILKLEPSDGDYFRVQLLSRKKKPEELGIPELVVLAEGGKSATVKQLGLESVRFSYPKYFMSAHVEIPFGPRTRRIDLDVRELAGDPGIASAEVSLWASGHGHSDEGTWIVIEVPESLLNQQSHEAEEYFLKGAMRLLSESDSPQPGRTMTLEEVRERVLGTLRKGALLSRKRNPSLPGMEIVEKPPFAGTFRFEQQCLKYPVAGKNVVVLGDAAGMGHHALSSGLEMGAHDLGPLGNLCDGLALKNDPQECLSRYAEDIFGSRLRLLGLGMSEYYPNTEAGRLKMLHRAAEIFHEETE
jgi:2-polyprenyl-6-methoxyphenol hydroxylase-like FAD-dependent oxidoreductase